MGFVAEWEWASMKPEPTMLVVSVCADAWEDLRVQMIRESLKRLRAGGEMGVTDNNAVALRVLAEGGYGDHKLGYVRLDWESGLWEIAAVEKGGDEMDGDGGYAYAVEIKFSSRDYCALQAIAEAHGGTPDVQAFLQLLADRCGEGGDER